MHGKRKKTNHNAIFLSLKIMDWITNAKNVEKKSSKVINEAINNFPITYQSYKDDLNKFVLLLRKGVYPYEDMDSW